MDNPVFSLDAMGQWYWQAGEFYSSCTFASEAKAMADYAAELESMGE